MYAAAERAEDPDAALYSRADAVGMLVSSGTGGQLCEAYGAFADELMVGELMITARLRDNLQVARVWIWVDPAHQRCGIGARLSSYADTRAGELGRSVCHATARIGVDRANGNLAFAERMGYALANTEIGRRFGMPADPALVGRPAAEAAPHHRDYAIRTVVGPVPDDLAASYTALRNRRTRVARTPSTTGAWWSPVRSPRSATTSTTTSTSGAPSSTPRIGGTVSAWP